MLWTLLRVKMSYCCSVRSHRVRWIDIETRLEHLPTYTTGRRDGSQNPDELHPEEKKVQHVGAEFHITKRGGQVTYHGPGQLVGYPILDLNAMETPTRCYVEFLQALLAAHLSEDLKIPGILAPHPDGHVGVFSSPTEKVGAVLTWLTEGCLYRHSPPPPNHVPWILSQRHARTHLVVRPRARLWFGRCAGDVDCQAPLLW